MENIQNDKLDEQLNDGLDTVQYDSCYCCNGFYGPNFGEPICGTCHDFLYAEDFELVDVIHHPLAAHANNAVAVNPSSLSIEKDDGDSGNDEPSEEAGPAVRISRGRPAPSIWGVEGGNLDESDNSNCGAQGDDNVPRPAQFVIDIPIGGRQRRASDDSDEAVGHVQAAPEMNEKIARRLTLLTTPSSNPGALTQASNDEDLCAKLPMEMWAVIFKMLDDTSVLMVSKVCRKWKTLMHSQFPDAFWEQYIKEHWPLLRPIYNVESWHSLCSDLIDSLPCKSCYFDMKTTPVVDTNERTLRQSRLSREIKWLRIDHPEGIEATPLDSLNYNWLARINGPSASPYQGGIFYLNLKIHSDYPLKPPVVRFLTKIFHPNVSRHGDIGIDCIQHNWTLALTIAQILLSVQSLLTDPYLSINMEPNAASLYQNDKKMFDKVARVWTWKYAMHDVLVH